MKKLFLVAMGIFAFSLFVNLEKEKASFDQNALADGTCCPEEKSKCILNNDYYIDYYHKTSGSCKSNPQII